MVRYKQEGWCEKAPAARGGCANFATGKKAKAAKAKGKKKAREQRKRDAEAQEAKAQEAREREAAEREAAKREAQRQRFEASSVRTSLCECTCRWVCNGGCRGSRWFSGKRCG